VSRIDKRLLITLTALGTGLLLGYGDDWITKVLVVLIGVVAVILWVGIRLLDFVGTDPLVWEDRQRQIRNAGKTHLQRTKESLSKAKRAMRSGKADVALEIVEKAEEFLNLNLGPLDTEQKEERELIRDFRKKFNSKLKGQ